MPRSQTLAFALKLLGIADDAKQSLTHEEVLEAFLNITRVLEENRQQRQIEQNLAARIEAATKRNPNLVN
jgi:hypothetical protein